MATQNTEFNEIDNPLSWYSNIMKFNLTWNILVCWFSWAIKPDIEQRYCLLKLWFSKKGCIENHL